MISRFVIVLAAICASLALAEEKTNKSRLREVLESWLPTVGDDATMGSPTTFGDGTTAQLNASDLLSPDDLKLAIPWRASIYDGQTSALGWSETAFAVPEKMKERVAFWRDVYSKYTTEQGVLHDGVNVQVIYDTVDFAPIMKDPSLSFEQKAKARDALVETKKDEIQRRIHIDRARLRFQLGQKDRFLLGIYYSGRYMRAMEEIFRKEGLPIELTRLPFVESSFNVNARSKVGASGVWQFMPKTAKQYMRVNKDVDERNDPLIATRASAKLLKQNFAMLGSWPLALTGYNHGAYGVKTLMAKFKTNELSELLAKDSTTGLGFASQNFYACFLAALELEHQANITYGDPKWSPEIESAEFKTAGMASWRAFLQFFDDDEGMARTLNPHVTSRVREGKSKIPGGVVLRVPPNRVKVAENFFAGKFPASKIASQLKSLPMPKSLYSASSMLTAARAVIRQRLAQTPRTSLLVLPELLARAPRAAGDSEAQWPAPLVPVIYRTKGEESP